MGLNEALDVALTVQSIELFGKNLIDVGLEDGRNAHSFILEATVMGTIGCFQYVVFTNFLLIMC